MAWADLTDLENRFGAQFVSALEDGGALVSDALADAHAEAEGWVSNVVTLPFAQVPASLKRIVCIIARYNLCRRDLTQDHPVYIAYTGAVSELRAISRGEIRLIAAVAPATSATASPAQRTMYFSDAILALTP